MIIVKGVGKYSNKISVKDDKSICLQDLVKAAFFFFLISAPVFIYLAHMTAFYPWKRLNDINLFEPLRFPLYEFALACGPALVLAVVGMFLTLVGRKKIFLPMTGWLGGIFILMMIMRQIPNQNALRFTQVAHFVPIGMLAALFLRYLAVERKKYALSIILMVFVLAIGSGHMGISLMHQWSFIRQRVIATQPDVPRFPQVMYPWMEFMDAIRWIGNHTPEGTVVLADDTLSSYLPSYSGRRVYCCHANTPHKEDRQVAVWAFYQGKQAKDWLKELGVSYIMFGQQEKETSGMYGITDIKSIYPFLAKVYGNERVTIYRVP